jgi:hypothetical protein
MLKVMKAAGFNLSINSFGLWRDLIRHAPVAADHWEQYLIVAARQGELLKSSCDDFLSPYIGGRELLELQKANRFRAIESTYSLLVQSVVAGRASRTSYLHGPFRNDDGQCWIATSPDLKSAAGDNETELRSTLLLMEDDKLLGPPHSFHADIRRIGGGRYSHWKSQLYFSTSDNTDPNANGRRYRISYVRPTKPK